VRRADGDARFARARHREKGRVEADLMSERVDPRCQPKRECLISSRRIWSSTRLPRRCHAQRRARADGDSGARPHHDRRGDRLAVLRRGDRPYGCGQWWQAVMMKPATKATPQRGMSMRRMGFSKVTRCFGSKPRADDYKCKTSMIPGLGLRLPSKFDAVGQRFRDRNVMLNASSWTVWRPCQPPAR